jgi:tetratricopeptide (TPR) repeat protein
MPKINVRFAAIVLAALVVGAVGVHVLHRLQTRRHATYYLEQARTARADGNLFDAGDFYQRYLALNPRDSEVLAEFGLVRADLGLAQNDPTAMNEAYNYFETALRAGASWNDPELQEKSRRKLAEVSLRLGRYVDAETQLKLLLKTSPKDGELSYLLAQSCLARRDYEAAKKPLSDAAIYAPDKLSYQVAYASLLRNQLNQAAAAEAWLDKMVADNPANGLAYAMRAQERLKAAQGAVSDGLRQKTEADLKKAVELAPDNPDVLRMYAEFLRRTNRADEARKYAEQSLALKPDAPAVYLLLAEIEKGSKAPLKAIEKLRAGLERAPNSAELLRTLASLLVDVGKPDEAKPLIEQLRGLPDGAGLADFIQGKVEMLAGNWKAAADVLEQAYATLSAPTRQPFQANPAQTRGEINVLLAGCYERLGQRDDLVKTLRRELQNNPLAVWPRFGLASSFAAAGRLDDAIKEQETAVRLGGATPAACLQLARWMTIAKLRMPAAQRDWRGVESLLDAAAKGMPNSPDVAVMKAEILVIQKQPAEAEKILAVARQQNPKLPLLWIASIRLARQQQNWDAVDRLLQEAEKNLGDVGEVRLAKAQSWIERYGAEATPKLATLAEKIDAWKPADRAKLLADLAALSMRQGNAEQAKKLAHQAVEQDAGNLGVLEMEFEVLFHADDLAGMQRLVPMIEKADPKGATFLIRKAMWLLAESQGKDKKALDEAAKCLEEAGKRGTPSPRLSTLKGQVDEWQGREDEALAHYLAAIEAGERDPAIFQRALQLLFTRKKFAEADLLVRKLGEQGTPLSPEMNRLTALISAQGEDPKRALTIARQLASQSQDYRDQLLLGQVLQTLAERSSTPNQAAEAKAFLDEAEKALRRAVELSPQTPATWLSLVSLLTTRKETQAAEKAVAEAASKIPPAQAPVALAQCYEMLGKANEAASQYEAALAKAPKDLLLLLRAIEFYVRRGNFAQAEKLLNRIVDESVPAEPDVVRDARRRLASILVTRGDHVSRQRATQLIEKNLEQSPASLEDLRSKALILTSDQKKRSRAEAVAILEKLLKDERLANVKGQPEAMTNLRMQTLFLLSQLYATDENWGPANQVLRELLAFGAKDPRFVVAMIQAQMKQRHYSEVESWIDMLEKVAPDELSTAQLRAETLAATGKYDEAIKHLKAYLRKFGGEKPEKSPLALRIAYILDGLAARLLAAEPSDYAKKLTAAQRQQTAEKFLQEAIALVRPYVADHAESRFLLASLLARHGQIDEALGIAEQPVQADELGAMAGFLSDAAGTAKCTPAQVKRLESILDAAMQKHGRTDPLLLVMADLYSLEGRFNDVEALYRDVLKRNPDHVVALNNLAVQLALQGKQLDEALKMVDRTIAQSGRNAALLDSRAIVLMAMNRAEEALAELDEALEDAPRPTRHFHRAQACFALDKRSEARTAWTEGRKIGLKPEVLHPLERPAYDKLEAALK